MKNEKTAVYHNSGLNNNFNDQKNYTKSDEKTQLVFNFGSQPPRITTTSYAGQNAGDPHFCFIGMRLVCDECAVPLLLYGENFIESYKAGKANVLRCLCDLHAAELLEVGK